MAFSIRKFHGNYSPNVKTDKFKMRWTVDELEEFNDKLKQEFIDNSDSSYNYDTLIYVLSSHGDGKNLVYDSHGEQFISHPIYHQFDNKECKKLRNKPKIYLFDTQRLPNVSISKNSHNSTKKMATPLQDRLSNDKSTQVKCKFQILRILMPTQYNTTTINAMIRISSILKSEQYIVHQHNNQ